MNRTHRAPWLHIGVAALLLLMLGGPSPGAIGSCSDEDTTADAVEHCREKRAWECARDRATNRIDEAGLQMCREAIPRACSGARWSCDEPPTTRQTSACIAVLMDPSRVSEPSNTIRECALCGDRAEPNRDASTDAMTPVDGGADAARDATPDATSDASDASDASPADAGDAG